VPCLTASPRFPQQLARYSHEHSHHRSRNKPAQCLHRESFENNGGLSAFITRSYLASDGWTTRLTRTINSSSDTHSATSGTKSRRPRADGFSRGSTILTYDNTLRARGSNQFSANTQNELRIQWSYNKFNVTADCAQRGWTGHRSFANLGTNIFLPSFTTTNRPEVADNVTLIRGRHNMRFGYYAHRARQSHAIQHFFPAVRIRRLRAASSVRVCRSLRLAG